MVKKFDDMFSRFETIPACDRQTDKRTDISDSIIRAIIINKCKKLLFYNNV